MEPKQIQSILNAHGFPCGVVDGILGPASSAAVTRFQQAYCGPGGWLEIDGEAGPKTTSALQWTADNNALVSFFTIDELKCKHCDKAHVKRELLSAMFRLRQAIGPVVVVSAYRCEVRNAQVGGANHSEHVAGEAFDCVKGTVTESQAHAAGFHGIGHDNAHGGAIDHLDIRPVDADFSDAGNG